MISNKLEKKSIQLKNKSGKLLSRQSKRKQSIPGLLIDLQEDRSSRNSLSDWNKNYDSNLSMMSDKNRGKNKENDHRQKAVSFRNSSNFKTIQKQSYKDELEFLKLQNQNLKNQNFQLRCRISQLQRSQNKTISEQIYCLKQQLQASKSEQLSLQQKFHEIRIAYEQVCHKTRQLYSKLLEQKKWQKQLSNLVMSLHRDQVTIGQSIYTNQQQFDVQTRADYNGSRNQDHSYLKCYNRKQFIYDNNY